jgi:hypothetical protein
MSESNITIHDALMLSEEDSAYVLGISKPVFRDWVGEGLIAPVKLPSTMRSPNGLRRNLYRRSDLEAFVAALELMEQS